MSEAEYEGVPVRVPRTGSEVIWRIVALDVTHCPGVLNPGSPLCLEAQAANMGWSPGRIRDVRFDGWPTIREAGWDCPECREQAHA
jgi:hypothetical protein